MSDSPINSMIDRVVKPVSPPDVITGDIPYVTHEGILDLGGIPLKVYVLNDGRRIIDSEDIKKFFGGKFIM